MKDATELTYPLKFYQGKKLIVIAVIVGLLFIGCSKLFISDDRIGVAYTSLTLGCLLVLMGIFWLLSPFLVLSHRGITLYSPFRKQFILWEDIFEVYSYRKNDKSNLLMCGLTLAIERNRQKFSISPEVRLGSTHISDEELLDLIQQSFYMFSLNAGKELSKEHFDALLKYDLKQYKKSTIMVAIALVLLIILSLLELLGIFLENFYLE